MVKIALDQNLIGGGSKCYSDEKMPHAQFRADRTTHWGPRAGLPSDNEKNPCTCLKSKSVGR